MSTGTIVTNQSKQHENKSSVIVHSTIFKLVEAIEKKVKRGQTDNNLDEMKQLREHCGSESPLVSVTACQGLVYLVKAFVCPLPNTVSALVSSLFSVKSVSGVTSALTDLLVLEMRCQLSTESKYTCPYTTRAPLHPLVAVLKRRPLAWPDVLNHINAVCCHPDSAVQSNRLELVWPVLEYVLMEKNELPESCRLQAFSLITQHFSDSDFLVQTLAACLCWEDSRVLEVVQLVTGFARAALHRKHGLQVSLCCLVLGVLTPRLLKDALCPLPTLHLLSQLCLSAVNTHSTVVALLAESIATCPAVYLEHLLAFLVELLRLGQCSLDCTWMCVSGLLPWLTSNPSHLGKAVPSASVILTHAADSTANPCTTATLINNTAVAIIVSADSSLTQAVHIARLSETLWGDSTATLRWLGGITAAQTDQVYHFISALLVSRVEPAVRLAAVEKLVDSKAPAAVSHNLTLFLYQLARERDPHVHLALLRALPTTAVHKNNVLAVMSTLEALRQSGPQHLSLLAVDLYCQLWMFQERCYPQLMDVLNQDPVSYEAPWLANILQASICKAICNAKPEMHGKEVVSKVSEILNRCGGAEEGAASALALDSLVPLCRNDVVDVYTIWKSLAPRFSRDKRPAVLKSLCELLSVAAVQKSASQDTDDTLAQILKWLWNLVATSKVPSVVEDALKALSKFPLDQMNLKMLPECFRKGLKLPPEMAKTPVDAARRPEDVLDYIPGECWVQLLQYVGDESASLAVASWVKMEVAVLKGRMLYQVDRSEPISYAHLPYASVVRGVTTSLQHSAGNRDFRTANLLMVALLQPSSKPLPSLSWTFLEVLTDPALSLNVVRLAAKQSQISPSARKITENFIAQCGNDKEKIEFLYSILGDLCRGIPPNTLRPFIEKTLHAILDGKDNEHFSRRVRHLKATLKDEKIHDANRTMLTQQVKLLWDQMEPQNENFAEFMECVSELGVSVVESMTSASLMWEVTSAQLQRAFRLRAHTALLPLTQRPLNWLNEIIELAATNISERGLALQLITEVISRLSSHETVWPWLQELMGQTHLSSLNNKEGIEFLVEVFVLCVDIVSGYSCLSFDTQDTRELRFPQAVATLVSRHGDAKSMLEWLNHMKNVDSFPTQFKAQFLLAARNVSLILG